MSPRSVRTPVTTGRARSPSPSTLIPVTPVARRSLPRPSERLWPAPSSGRSGWPACCWATRRAPTRSEVSHDRVTARPPRFGADQLAVEPERLGRGGGPPQPPSAGLRSCATVTPAAPAGNPVAQPEFSGFKSSYKEPSKYCTSRVPLSEGPQTAPTSPAPCHVVPTHTVLLHQHHIGPPALGQVIGHARAQMISAADDHHLCPAGQFRPCRLRQFPPA